MFTDPIKNLKQFNLREDMVVVDLGAGTGFYSIIAAEMMNRGKVYAVEIIKDFLITIRQKAKDLDLDNLETIWGDIEKVHGTHLGDGIADAVIISNVFSQIENHDNLIKETSRILKKDGKVLVIDWVKSFSNDQKVIQKIFNQQEALSLFDYYNFKFEKEIDAGLSHYGIIFKK